MTNLVDADAFESDAGKTKTVTTEFAIPGAGLGGITTGGASAISGGIGTTSTVAGIGVGAVLV